MAKGASLVRVSAETSNVDAGVYATLDLRVALHPSEDMQRLAARVVAYCVLYEEGLQFGPGLDQPEQPALFVKDGGDRVLHWVDVGHPGADRMHRASKAADRVSIVCHKSPEGLIRERDSRPIHRAERVAVWLLESQMVQQLGDAVGRNGRWTVVRAGQDLMVTVDEHSFMGSIIETRLTEL